MKNKNRILIYLIIAIGFILILTNSCVKDEKSSKKDPVITWENPADITYGTMLSETQLNATADVLGSFVYTPAIGTKLNEGTNQDLKVDFTPTDGITYNSASKKVKINVVSGPEIEWFLEGTIINYLYSNGIVTGFSFHPKFNVLKESGAVTINVHIVNDDNVKVSSTFNVEKGVTYSLSLRGIISAEEASPSPGSSCLTVEFSSPNSLTTQKITTHSYSVGNYTYHCATSLDFGESYLSK
jgi:hypothetical protein